MAPITGEGAEYEFRVVLALDTQHIASVSKDNTGRFDGRYWSLLKDKPGVRIAEWLARGRAVAPTPATNESGSTNKNGSINTTAAESELTIDEARALPLMGKADHWGGKGGQPPDTLPRELFEKARERVHRVGARGARA